MNRKKILYEVREKLEKLYEIDDDYRIDNFIQEIDKKIKICEYKEKYDIDLEMRDFYRIDWIDIDRYYGRINIGKGMKILNSVKQPKKDEELIEFCYPTGAYIFGGHSWTDDSYYDDETFDEFFEELKTYDYKYIDELNSYLYFDMNNGALLLKNYTEICKKYQKIWDERRIARRKKELEEELKKINGEDDE